MLVGVGVSEFLSCLQITALIGGAALPFNTLHTRAPAASPSLHLPCVTRLLGATRKLALTTPLLSPSPIGSSPLALSYSLLFSRLPLQLLYFTPLSGIHINLSFLHILCTRPDSPLFSALPTPPADNTPKSLYADLRTRTTSRCLAPRSHINTYLQRKKSQG